MTETEDYDKSATPTAHKTSHQDGGADELSVEGLAGELTAEQKSSWSKVSGKPSTFPPEAHALDGTTSHSTPTDITDLNATTLIHGLMPRLDKVKLDGIESGATKYPNTGEQAFLDADHTKLDGIEALADVTDAGNIGSSIHGATDKTPPVDADELGLIDSAASWVLKKLTWANLKATLKTYFDTLYSTSPGEGYLSMYFWGYASITQGTWVLNISTLQVLNFWYYNSSNAQNDQMDFKAYLAAGTYSFILMGLTNNNVAIVTLLFDGVSQGVMDFYSAAIAYNTQKAINLIVVTAAGLKTISVKGATRNASSTGWYMNLTSISLFRTA